MRFHGKKYKSSCMDEYKLKMPIPASATADTIQDKKQSNYIVHTSPVNSTKEKMIHITSDRAQNKKDAAMASSTYTRPLLNACPQ